MSKKVGNKANINVQSFLYYYLNLELLRTGTNNQAYDM